MPVDNQTTELAQQLGQLAMSNKDQLGRIIAELQKQNSTSPALHHTIDFFVILAADIGAAVVALITFDSWIESDQEDKKRASTILAAIGPLIHDLQERLPIIIEKMKVAPNTGFGFPWGEGSPTKRAFENPDLGVGSLCWEYPGGQRIMKQLQQLKAAIRHQGPNGAGADFHVLEAVLEAVADLNTEREKQIDTYVRGGAVSSWKRFAKWSAPKLFLRR